MEFWGDKVICGLIKVLNSSMILLDRIVYSYYYVRTITYNISKEEKELNRYFKRIKLEPEKLDVYLRKESVSDCNMIAMACYYNNEKVLRAMLKKLKPKDAIFTEGMWFSPIYIATMRGHTNIVKMLLKSKMRTKIEASYKDEMLNIACYKNNIELVKLLIEEGANVNTLSECGDSALHIACYNNNKELVKILLAEGADIESLNERGFTPLQVACCRNHVEVVKVLLENKADANARLVDFPLYIACLKGYWDIARMLIEHDADIVKGIEFFYSKRKTKYILNKTGVDVNMVDAKGRTMLHKVCQRECRCWMVEGLIESGANVNVIDNNGYSPLYLVYKAGDERIVDILVRNNADILLGLKYWKTVEEIVNLIQRNEVDINKVNDNGCTMLHEACEKGYTALAMWLIDQGADTGGTDKDGHTPLYIACSKENIELVNKLLEIDRIDITSIPTNISKNLLGIIRDKLQDELLDTCSSGNLERVEKFMNMAKYVSDTCLREIIRVSTGDVFDYLVDKVGWVNINKVYNKLDLDKRRAIVEKIFCSENILNHTKGGMRNDLKDRILKELELVRRLEDEDRISILLRTGIEVRKSKQKNEGVSDEVVLGYKGHKEIEVVRKSVEELLIEAIKDGNKRDIYKYLRDANLNLCVDEDGKTALMIAVSKGDEKTVGILLSKEIEINAVDNKGKTAIMMAVEKDNSDLVARFINCGADIEIADNSGRNVLMYALAKGKSMSRIIDGIMSIGVIDSRDKNNATPLMYACIGGYMESIERLVSYGSDVNAVDNKGNTPLSIAYTKNNKDVLRYLIKKGAINTGKVEKKNELYKLMSIVEKEESKADKQEIRINI